MPKISVIIPVYNAERYLPTCLEALLSQIYQNIEILCINDGSTDNSLAVLDSYAAKDNRVRVFSQENAGPARARNVGLENANGQYIMFCDADDWYEPNMCEVMIDTIQKTDADLVQCRCYVENEVGYVNENRETCVEYYNNEQIGEMPLAWNVSNVLLWNKIWKKSLIDEYHIRFPEGCEHDDDAFFYMYSLIAQNIYFISDELYHYLLRANSITDNYCLFKPKNRYDRLKICKYVTSFIMERNLFDMNKGALLGIWKSQFFVLFKLFRQEKQHIVDDAKYCIRAAVNDKHFVSSFEDIMNQFYEKDRCFDEFCNLKLFGVVPFLGVRKKVRPDRITISFWGMSLWKVKFKPGVSKHYLLGFIPVMTINQ